MCCPIANNRPLLASGIAFDREDFLATMLPIRAQKNRIEGSRHQQKSSIRTIDYFIHLRYTFCSVVFFDERVKSRELYQKCYTLTPPSPASGNE